MVSNSIQKVTFYNSKKRVERGGMEFLIGEYCKYSDEGSLAIDLRLRIRISIGGWMNRRYGKVTEGT